MRILQNLWHWLKRAQLISSLVMAAALGLVWTSPARAESPTQVQKVPAPVRTEEQLRHMLRHDCGSCHGMTLKGGLGVELTHEKMKDRNIEELQAIILQGRPGTAMPAWKGLLTEAEAYQLARILKEGSYEISK